MLDTDPAVAGLLEGLRCYAVDQLALTPAGAPGASLIRYAEQVPIDVFPADRCCEGLLVVRLMTVYPSDSFPVQANTVITSCDGLALAASVELTVWRCVKTVDAEGNPPPDTVVDAETAQRLADGHALRWTVVGYGNRRETLRSLGTATPAGPSGGCAGARQIGTFSVEGSCC